MRVIRDTALMFGYSWRSAVSNPVWLILGVIQPVLWLVLLGPLIQNVEGPGLSAGEQLEKFVPGVLILLALFTPLFTGFELVADIKSGVVERLTATRVSRAALLLGRVLKDVLGLLIQALVLVGVAVVMGLRPDALGLIASFLLLALTGVVAACVSYGFAFTLRDEGALASMLSTLTLPIMLLGGLLLPLSLAPSWIETIAVVNPFYHAVEAGRALMVGSFGDTSVPVGFGVLVVSAMLAIAWVVPMFRRANI